VTLWRREEREREEEVRERDGERERVERPGGNRTTPLKADHCQPENKRLASQRCLVLVLVLHRGAVTVSSTGPAVGPVAAAKGPRTDFVFSVRELLQGVCACAQRGTS